MLSEVLPLQSWLAEVWQPQPQPSLALPWASPNTHGWCLLTVVTCRLMRECLQNRNPQSQSFKSDPLRFGAWIWRVLGCVLNSWGGADLQGWINTETRVHCLSLWSHMRTLGFQPVLGKSVSWCVAGECLPLTKRVWPTQRCPENPWGVMLWMLCLHGVDTEEHLERSKPGSNTRSKVTPWSLHRQRCVKTTGNSDGPWLWEESL